MLWENAIERRVDLELADIDSIVRQEKLSFERASRNYGFKPFSNSLTAKDYVRWELGEYEFE